MKMNGTSSGRTEVHALGRGTNPTYSGYSLQAPTPVPLSTASSWRFFGGDANRDGSPDLVGVKLAGASGTTEIHILDGASNFQTYQLEKATPLQVSNASQFAFGVGDYNGDGNLDLYAIKMNGTASGMTEVHILDGATDYQTWLQHKASALHTTTTSQFSFGIADFNNDGRADVYAVKFSSTGSGKTEVHVLDAASNFTSFTLHQATSYPQTSASQTQFAVGHFDIDARPDLFAVRMNGTGSGKTEVHVLDGSSNFTAYSLSNPTVLPATTTSQWQFTVMKRASRVGVFNVCKLSWYPGVNTGLRHWNGDHIHISAVGSIWGGVPFTGANGPNGWEGWDAGSPAFAPLENPFSLIAGGYWGGQTTNGYSNFNWKYVGAYANFIVNNTVSPPSSGGNLLLGINDNRLNEGSGCFSALVKIDTP
jgi:hypothetical protein